MTEATPQGADLQSAADAIVGLMDGGNKKKQPSEASHDEQPRSERSTKQEDAPDDNESDDASKEADAEESQDNDTNDGDESETAEEYELPSSIDALAEAMGIDTGKLLGIKVKTKIDGQEGEASLADLVKSYQLEGHLNKKSMAMSEQQKAYEAHITQQKQAMDQQAQELNTYFRYAENELFRDFNNVDWDALRDYNPAEWTAKRQEFNDRYQTIQNFGQQVNQKIQHNQVQQQEQFKQQVVQIVENESKQLLNKIPEWSNGDKKSAEQKEMRGYLKGHGFDDEDLNSVIDHRYVLLARKAWLYDKLAQSKPQVNKKVKTLPAFIKQSGLKSKADVRAEKYTGKIKQLKKSGSIKDAASLLFDMI